MRLFFLVCGTWTFLASGVVILYNVAKRAYRKGGPDGEYQAFTLAEEFEANKRGYRPFQEDPRFEGDKIIYRS